jgi:hypothetical protein
VISIYSFKSGDSKMEFLKKNYSTKKKRVESPVFEISEDKSGCRNVYRCIYCKKISLDKKTWLSDATPHGTVSDTICPYCSEKKFPNLYK